MDRRALGKLMTGHMAEIRCAFAELLSQRFGRPVDEIRDEGLGARDFSTREEVELLLPDGSLMRFRYAFAVVDEAARVAAVFSEHCGYYTFCGPNLRLTTFRDGEVVSTLTL